VSASEKLKALWEWDGLGDPWLSDDGKRTLIRALPQIVAVVDQFEAFVEILERSRDPWKEIEERLRNVAPELLSALDEALS